MGWSTRYIILWPVSGYKIFGEADRENLRKQLHWLERWTSEVVSIVLLIPDFNIPAPGYTPWLIKSIFTVYRVNTYITHLALHMQSQTNMANV